MARRGWVRSVPLALAAAAVTAAAQLGLGYGLGIIAWTEAGGSTAAPGGAWSASLAWSTWAAAVAVVLGAVVGDRAAGRVRSGPLSRAIWRLVVALAAAIGALITVPLVALPARQAQIVDNYAPHLLAAVYATAGVVVGLVVALFSLTSRAVAANLLATAGWLWVLATVAMVDGIAGGRGPGYAQLAVWRFTEGGPVWRSYYIPGALLMLAAALLIGGLAAFPAAGRGEGRLGIALSGITGPVVVAIAYALAAPKPSEAPIEQVSAYHTAPLLLLAGLAGSALVAIVGGVPSRPRKVPASTPRPSTPPQIAAARNPPPTGIASVPASSRADPAEGFR